MGDVVNFIAPSRTITESIGGYTVTFTYDQQHKRWNVVVHYTEEKEMHRHAPSLDKARRIAATMVDTIDKIGVV